MHSASRMIVALFLFIFSFTCISANKLEVCTRYIAGRYIVILGPNTDLVSFFDRTKIAPIVSWNLLNGFAASLNKDQVKFLCNDHSIESISQDGKAKNAVTLKQRDSDWNLARLTSSEKVDTTSRYVYQPNAGFGVDIYILDTGVYTQHKDFGGRAIWGKTYATSADQNKDKNGHGTHCAGIAASRTYGVAKKAAIIGVKVLDDEGAGDVHEIISGMLWVTEEQQRRQRPSVASISISMAGNDGIDKAVKVLTDHGIHVVTAAGNDNKNANLFSPARASTGVTVGATDKHDKRAFFSNHGPRVDVYAPGHGIRSTFIHGLDATQTLSGTSMATPHIAGLIACLITMEGNLRPAEMKAKVIRMSLPVGSILPQSPRGHMNRIAHLRL